MIKIYVLNALSEPFPSKCQILNSILETANPKVIPLNKHILSNLNLMIFFKHKTKGYVHKF